MDFIRLKSKNRSAKSFTQSLPGAAKARKQAGREQRHGRQFSQQRLWPRRYQHVALYHRIVLQWCVRGIRSHKYANTEFNAYLLIHRIIQSANHDRRARVRRIGTLYKRAEQKSISDLQADELQKCLKLQKREGKEEWPALLMSRYYVFNVSVSSTVCSFYSLSDFPPCWRLTWLEEGSVSFTRASNTYLPVNYFIMLN